MVREFHSRSSCQLSPVVATLSNRIWWRRSFSFHVPNRFERIRHGHDLYEIFSNTYFFLGFFTNVHTSIDFDETLYVNWRIVGSTAIFRCYFRNVSVNVEHVIAYVHEKSLEVSRVKFLAHPVNRSGLRRTTEHDAALPTVVDSSRPNS